MPITYTASESEGLVVSVWNGDISIADVREYWTKLLQDKQARALGRSLADLRGATLLFTDQDLQLAIQEVITPHLTGKGWILAVVVTTPSQFHTVARYQGLAFSYSRDAIFSSIEEAKRWVMAQQRRTA